jgi:hypothetical protein
MTPPESMRAGNDDREKVVARLNTAFAEGRLDVGELDERVAAAYAARTMGELVPLTADLPAQYSPPPVPAPRPAAGTMKPRPIQPGEPSAIDWTPIGGGLALFLVNVLIWAVVSLSTQDLVYFWPVWTAIPLVLAVVGTFGRRHGGHGNGHGGHR